MMLPDDPDSGDSRETATRSEDHGDWLAWALEEFPRVVMGLTAEERKVVIGFFFDDRTIEDLAATLGLPAERVQFALEAGCDALRAKLRR